MYNELKLNGNHIVTHNYDLFETLCVIYVELLQRIVFIIISVLHIILYILFLQI